MNFESMFPSIAPDILVMIAGIFFLAGVLKGILGFGLPLVVMALLPLLLPVTMSIVLAAIVQPFTNIGQLIAAKHYRESLSAVWPVLISLWLGVALGVRYLSGLSQESIIFIVGLTIVGYCLFNLSGGRISVPHHLKVHFGLGAGLVAGLIGALTAINGAIFVVYLVGLGLPRQVFRSSLAILFIVSSLLISTGFYLSGILKSEWLWLGMACLVPSFVGMWVGNLIGARFSSDGFRKAVIAGLLVIGMNLTLRGSGLL